LYRTQTDQSYRFSPVCDVDFLPFAGLTPGLLTSFVEAKRLFPGQRLSHLHWLGGRLKRPSLGSILLALIPFAAVCFSVSLWDRIYPLVLGLPFNFFWLISWLVLTPVCMWGAYRLEAPRLSETKSEGKGGA
jgi:Protein of unknown function (DUF3311)